MQQQKWMQRKKVEKLACLISIHVETIKEKPTKQDEQKIKASFKEEETLSISLLFHGKGLPI